MPYNYIIDEKIRENYEVEYENSVIIFDEAHNIAQCSEDVSSFQLKDTLLDTVMKELHSLQESRSQNDQREWKTTTEDIDTLEKITRKFMKYLNNFDINQKSVYSSRYLPDRSVVLEGKQVFNIFFEGTEIEDFDQNGRTEKKQLCDHWESIQTSFNNALLDIADISNDSVRANIEGWYDVLKKVMRMYESGLSGFDGNLTTK